MRSICLYFQVHQPFRLRTYRFFDIGSDHYYYDDYQNKRIVRRIAAECYLPANEVLLALINEYETSTGKSIYHFDFYRIKNITEAFDFGYEDYFFSDEYCFIEWPELIEQLLPPNCIKVYISETGNGNRMIESNI